MTEPETIPLTPDTAAEDVAGKPAPLEGESTVTIENPDAPVNLGADVVVVDGVPEGDKMEEAP